MSEAAISEQDSYVVTEGKKRGSTREVRPEATIDKWYTVVKVHPGRALLTDNWHTNEVLGHIGRTSRAPPCRSGRWKRGGLRSSPTTAPTTRPADGSGFWTSR